MLLNKTNNFLNSTKTKTFFCLCGFFITVQHYSQVVHYDSLNIDQSEKDFRINNPEIAFSNPLYFSEINVFYNSTDLNFKRVQTPGSITKYGFESKGIFKFSPKVILSGKLEVSREDEKNVSFILTDERTIDTNYISNPTYFYVPRESDWMKQNYKVAANLAYQPIKNVFLTGSVEGKFLKAYANSDPRPEISNFDYKGSVKLGYQYKKHRVFALAEYFNHRKESGIIYSNTELNAPSNYDTYIRFNMGYGNYYYNNGYATTFYKYDGLAYGAEYDFAGEKNTFQIGYRNDYYIDRFFRTYSYQKYDENNQLSYFYDDLKLTGLRTEKNSVYANYIGLLGSTKWNSALSFTDQKDTNFDYQNSYTSYRVFNTNVSFRNVFTRFNSKNEMLRFGLNTNFGDQDIKDISVILNKKLTYFDYKIFAEKEIRTAVNQKLAVGINQGLYLPIDYSFNYIPYQSNQENTFIKNIAQPDYWYDSSKRFSLGMNLKYLVDGKKMRTEIYADFNQMFFVTNDNKTVKSLINTESNKYLIFGLNFYY